MRKLALLTAFVTLVGILASGCGPKLTKEEESAPPSRGPGVPSAGGGPGTAGAPTGGPGSAGSPAPGTAGTAGP